MWKKQKDMQVISITGKTRFKCSVCGENRFKKLKWYNGWFSFILGVSICKKCGTVCLNPRMNEQDYEEYYRSQYYGNYQPKPICSETINSKGNKIFRHILPYIKKESTILEIGCGPGGNLITLKNEGFHNIMGLEPSLECCLILNEYGIDCKNSGLLNYVNSSPGIFDSIILSGVLEHFVEPDKSLILIRDLLKEDGLIYISVPNIYGFIGKCTHDLFTIPHTFYFSVSTLERLLTNSGFEIIECFKGKENEISLIAKKKKMNETLKSNSSHEEYIQVLKYLKSDRLYITNFPKLTRRITRAIGGQILRKFGLIKEE